MRKMSRLFEIVQMLCAARVPLTGADLAERLEVAPRTIYRDIAALQAMRVPVEGERGIGYVLHDGFTLPPLMFTLEEIEALVVALGLLDRLRGARILDGVRGRPGVDRAAVAAVISRLSVLAAANADTVESIEINPLLARADGAVALDALILPVEGA